MLFEYSGIQTKLYKNNLVYFIKKQRPVNLVKLSINNLDLTVWLNDLQEVIGIKTNNSNDIYSPRKLKNLVEKELGKVENISELYIDDVELLDWWMEEITKMNSEKPSPYDDVELTKYDLRNYFVQTVEKSCYDDCPRTVWYTYYLNESLGGLSVKLGKENTVDYSSFSINKIVLTEEGNEQKRISFYTKDDLWLEDVDIRTSLSWNDIRFVFDNDDLENMSSKDEEKQAFIELYENLNPYNTVDENKTILDNWLRSNNYGKED